MITISYTDKFLKHYKKLSNVEKEQFKKKLNQFISDPLTPSLRTKKIKGTKDIFEFSVNMDIRVIWHYEGNNLIILIDIGHHDILKKLP